MTVQKKDGEEQGREWVDPAFIGAEAALLRAAKAARRLAMVTTGSIVVFKDGKIVYEKVPWEPLENAESD